MSDTDRIIAEIKAERERQKAKYSAEHDDSHESGELADAAAALIRMDQWPFDTPTELFGKPIRERLVIAAAILVAEIDRQDRAAEASRQAADDLRHVF